MIEIELTKEERELLNLELINSQTTRNKEIKKGILTLVVSILATISLWAFTDKIRFINNFIAIFLCFGLFGAYKSIWWYRAKSVDKLASDIKNGIKLQDRSEIKSYSKQSHKVRLLNDTGLAGPPEIIRPQASAL